MSFWLEDDDDPVSSQNNSQPFSGNVYLASQQDSQEVSFVCENCGGTDSYLDESAGTLICSSCYTQSQSYSQVENDYEDVVGLAARNAVGHIQQRTIKAGGADGTGTDGRKRTLREWRWQDNSVPLPDTAACLRGVKCVLQGCVQILVRDCLKDRILPVRTPPNDNSNANRSAEADNSEQILQELIEAKVKQLWMAYLTAWSTGAEYYGALYPHVRFSFRDLFLNAGHALLLRKHLVHRAFEDAVPDAAASGTQAVASILEAQEAESDVESADSGRDSDDRNAEPKLPSAIPSSTTAKPCPVKIRANAIRQVVQHHTANMPKGHMEAALSLEPSMAMIAALLWLAIAMNKPVEQYIGAPVTSQDISLWIMSGKLPLMSAYSNLFCRKKRLQERLSPIRNFFRMDKPLAAARIEALATNLCVACRLKLQLPDGKTEPTVVLKDHMRAHVRFWSVAKLPRLLAQLVANAGLGQGVLERTLTLAGIPVEVKTQPIEAVHPQAPLQFPAMPPMDMMPPPSPGLNMPWPMNMFSPPFPWQNMSMPTNAMPPPLRGSNAQIAENTISPPPHVKRGRGRPRKHEKVMPWQLPDKPRHVYKKRKPACEDGLPELKKIPMIVDPLKLTKVEELLALIAIACQMDPEWKKWKYSVSETAHASPWNEAQFQTITSNPAAIEAYLKFVETTVYPEDEVASVDGTSQTLLPREYFDPARLLQEEQELALQSDTTASEAVATSTRPQPIISGELPPGKIEASNMRFRREHVLNEDGSFKVKSGLSRWHQPGLDPLYRLPRHDFRQADRAASDWIPQHFPDADQERLLEFLAYVTNADYPQIVKSMQKLIEKKKL
jgi:hypothetical protein